MSSATVSSPVGVQHTSRFATVEHVEDYETVDFDTRSFVARQVSWNRIPAYRSRTPSPTSATTTETTEGEEEDDDVEEVEVELPSIT